MLLLKADVDDLDGQEFAEGVDDSGLIRRKTRMISIAAKGESAQECFAHGNGLHQASSAGMGARKRIIRAQGLRLIKEYISLGQGSFRFGACPRHLDVQINRRKGKSGCRGIGKNEFLAILGKQAQNEPVSAGKMQQIIEQTVGERFDIIGAAKLGRGTKDRGEFFGPETNLLGHGADHMLAESEFLLDLGETLGMAGVLSCVISGWVGARVVLGRNRLRPRLGLGVFRRFNVAARCCGRGRPHSVALHSSRHAHDQAVLPAASEVKHFLHQGFDDEQTAAMFFGSVRLLDFVGPVKARTVVNDVHFHKVRAATEFDFDSGLRRGDGIVAGFNQGQFASDQLVAGKILFG